MSDFVVKALINGVEKKAEVVANRNLVATFEDVDYYHSINVADLDESKIYDLEGNELEREPAEGYCIQYKSFTGKNAWGLLLAPDYTNPKAILSNGASTVGYPLREGAISNLDTNYLANAYIKINEDEATATLYFSYLSELYADPVNYGTLGLELKKVKEEVIPEIDLSSLNSISVSDLLNALGLEYLSSTFEYNVLVKNIKYKYYGSTPNTGMLAMKIKNTELVIEFLSIKWGEGVETIKKEYSSSTISTTTINFQNDSTIKYFLPDKPSETSQKTFVLKLVNGTLSWVEETAQ